MALFRALVLPLLALATLSAQTRVAVSRALSDTAMVYDQARQRLVFGLATGEIYEWDGQRWGMTGAQLPGRLNDVVYDPARRRVFFVCLGHLYAYDGHALVDHGTMPGEVGLVADAQRSRLVALSSIEGATVAGYEWDGATWLTTTAMLPPLGSTQLHLRGLAYDPQRAVTVAVMYSADTRRYSTWEWDGTTWSMQAQGASGVYVPGNLAFDATRQEVVGPIGGTMFAWNGVDWTPLATAHSSPVVTSLSADPAHGVVFGFRDSVFAESLSVWNGVDWAPGPHVTQPMRGWDAGFTFDSRRGRVVLFAYSQDPASPPLVEWDGCDWHWLPTLGGPTPRGEQAQAFDAMRGETVLFGGSVNGVSMDDTWAWNGAAWRLAATTGPAPRRMASSTYDAARGRFVLVGGQLAAGGIATDHWEWDGVSWTEIASMTPIGSSPTGTLPSLLGYDPDRQRLVAVDQASNTYEFDGGLWQLVATSSPRPPGVERTLAWHPARHRLQGMLVDGNGFQRLCEWDGSQWTLGAGGIGRLLYDPTHGLMLGGIFMGPVWQVTAQSTTPASTVAFGSPCGGQTVVTSLSPFRRPVVGDLGFQLDVRCDATLRPAMIGFGLAAGNTPLLAGCTWFLTQPIGSLLWATDERGLLHMPVPLPDVQALRGVALYAQAGVLDPLSPGGIAVSQGLQFVLGI